LLKLRFILGFPHSHSLDLFPRSFKCTEKNFEGFIDGSCTFISLKCFVELYKHVWKV